MTKYWVRIGRRGGLLSRACVPCTLWLGMVFGMSACVTPRPSVSLDTAVATQSQRVLIIAEVPIFNALNLATEPTLNRYLHSVLENNPELQSMRATARAAQHLVVASRSQARPQTALSLTTNREKSAFEASPIHSVALTGEVQWALDIWGMLADGSDAQHFSGLQQAQLKDWAARVLLVKALDAWMRKYLIDQIITTFNRRAELQRALTLTMQQQYRNGLLPYERWIEQQSIEVGLRHASLEVHHERQQVSFLLNVLRGEHPNAPLDTSMVDHWALMLPLPATVSAQVLMNRPDILSAYSEVKLFDKKIHAAYKALLPQLTLSGQISKRGPVLNDVLGQSLLWGLIGGLSQPVWRGGELQALARSVSDNGDSAVWRYREVVLQALQEVETALSQEHTLQRQLQYQREVLQQQHLLLELSRQQYQLAEVSVIEYLQAKAQWMDTQIQLLELQSRFLSHRVALALALGEPLEALLHNQPVKGDSDVS